MPLNAMSIDVEDYFHVAAFKDVISPETWDTWPCRVEKNTHTILSLFNKYSVTGTFFILGWVAERYPHLVKEIQAEGHEIASHGYSHQLVYGQTPEIFRDETIRSKKLLEDITGEAIEGYRAASYSITKQSLWALEILGELGFKWDSSIFPIMHDNYGFADSPREPYIIKTRNGHEILEFPLSTAKVLGATIPAAGGGYFRQFPYAVSKWLMQKATQKNRVPTIFYLHPWEVDPEQPRIDSASWKSKFRHYTNLKRCPQRLERLLQEKQFTTMSKAMKDFSATTTMDLSTY